MSEPVWRRYLRFVRPDLARDVDDELAFHLAMREADYVAQGLDPEEARRRARARFGPVHEARKAALAVDRRYHAAIRRAQFLDALTLDVRYALRGLRQHAGFSAAVIGTLALGIGATTAIFSAVDAALLRPLPFASPGALVILPGVNVPFAPNGATAEPTITPDINQVALLRDVFSQVGAYAAGGFNLSGDGDALRVNVGVVTASLFGTLGVQPAMGRGFSADEGRPNGPAVAIISHGLWQRRFGGDEVLNRSIELNNRSYQIVGVMPRGFVFPKSSDLWVPFTIPMTFATFEAFRSWVPSETVARMAPGVTREMVRARMRDLWTNVPGQFREQMREYADDPVHPLQGALVGDRQKPLVVLMLTTGLLLLIACVNVTNLLLGRAALRRREIAMRAVLGASRRRLVAQLLVESLLLAVAGSAAGLIVAFAGLGTVRTLLPAAMAAVAPPSVDLRVLGFAIGVAIVTGLAFGLWPALGASRADANETLKSGGTGATLGGAGRLRRVLVAAELAVTLTLLAGSGLMLRSFKSLVDTDPGFQAGQVATMELTFARSADAGSEVVRRARIEAVLERLNAAPGIDAAGVVNDLPLRGGGGIGISISAEGAAPEEGEMRFARYLQASAGYFRALGIPLLRGRLMTASDDARAPHVVVINTEMAQTLWPGQDPIGRRLSDPTGRPNGALGGDSTRWRTVIGMVATVRERRLEDTPGMQMYMPVAEQTPQNAAIVARGTLPKSAMLAALREAMRAVDPTQPVYNVRMMDEVMHASLTVRRTNTVLIASFGALALVLSIVGVYGVVAFGVTRRTRELGIRAALGATGGSLVRLVAGESAITAVVGIALGLGGAWAFSRALRSLLYGVEPNDLGTFIAAPVVLFALVLLATLIPARRAAKLNPVDVIRQD